MSLPLSSLDRLDDVLYNLEPAELAEAIAALSPEELRYLGKAIWAMRARCAEIEALGRI